MLRAVVITLIQRIARCFPDALIYPSLVNIVIFFLEKRFGKEEIKKNKSINVIMSRQLFMIYAYIVLHITLIGRTESWSRGERIFAGWKLIGEGYGIYKYDSIANIILFIPLIVLLFYSFNKIIEGDSCKKILHKALKISFLVSLFIEVVQFSFMIGTFQFSDIAYNTIGGVIGGLFYTIKRKSNVEKDNVM